MKKKLKNKLVTDDKDYESFIAEINTMLDEAEKECARIDSLVKGFNEEEISNVRLRLPNDGRPGQED